MFIHIPAVLPCYTMLYHVIPCYTMLYHVIQGSSRSVEPLQSRRDVQWFSAPGKCVHRWKRRQRHPFAGWAAHPSKFLEQIIWVCLKMLCTPKPNGFADHYPYFLWLFVWEYTLFSDKPICQAGKKSMFKDLLISGKHVPISRMTFIWYFNVCPPAN